MFEIALIIGLAGILVSILYWIWKKKARRYGDTYIAPPRSGWNNQPGQEWTAKEHSGQTYGQRGTGGLDSFGRPKGDLPNIKHRK